MKNTQKIFAMLIALVLVLGVGSEVFAEGSSSLTVNNTGNTGHTFELYQIFKGDLSKGKLTNMTWGDGVSEEFSQGKDAQKYAEDNLKDEDSAIKFSRDIQEHLVLENAKVSTLVPKGESYTFANLDAGYYLVKDVDKSQSSTDSTYTQYILKVVGEVTVDTKLDVPTVEKHVKDKNDSTDLDFSDWQKTADHDIGDAVPFRLKGTLPSNYDQYEKYSYAFHDKLSEGLTLKEETIKVFVDGNPITEGFTIDNTAGEDKTFSIIFDDLKTINSVNKDSVITVEYEAELNKDAVIGSEGNPNEVYLVYSNNPNQVGEGEQETGETPKDKVIVFTYKVVINKVNQNNEPLEGAEFKLFKILKDGTEEEIELSLSEDKTTFTFKGLDEGKYILREVNAPAGYNKIEDVKFEVVSSLDEQELELVGLNGNKIDGSVELELTPNVQEGSLSANVVNKEGPELPGTGGMGTRIFYTLGIVLILGAVAFYFAEKKYLKNNM